MWRCNVEYTKVTKVLYQTIGSVTGVDRKMLQLIVIHLSPYVLHVYYFSPSYEGNAAGIAQPV